MGVDQAKRYHNMTGSHVESTAECLLKPKLFQLHFAAFLGLMFKLNGLVGFIFNGRTRATMLKFNLRSHRPALTKVIT